MAARGDATGGNGSFSAISGLGPLGMSCPLPSSSPCPEPLPKDLCRFGDTAESQLVPLLPPSQPHGRAIKSACVFTAAVSLSFISSTICSSFRCCSLCTEDKRPVSPLRNATYTVCTHTPTGMHAVGSAGGERLPPSRWVAPWQPHPGPQAAMQQEQRRPWEPGDHYLAPMRLPVRLG